MSVALSHFQWCVQPTGNGVAAFARTRVNPAVGTDPHSGECGYRKRRSRVRPNAGKPSGRH